jgi:hypothetical protein
MPAATWTLLHIHLQNICRCSRLGFRCDVDCSAGLGCRANYVHPAYSLCSTHDTFLIRILTDTDTDTDTDKHTHTHTQSYRYFDRRPKVLRSKGRARIHCVPSCLRQLLDMHTTCKHQQRAASQRVEHACIKHDQHDHVGLHPR